MANYTFKRTTDANKEPEFTFKSNNMYIYTHANFVSTCCLMSNIHMHSINQLQFYHKHVIVIVKTFEMTSRHLPF